MTDVTIQGLTPEERRLLLLSVGTHKSERPLSPVEVAELFQKATRAGATFSDCAQAAHLEGTTWVGRFLRLLALPSSVRHVVDWRGGRGSVGILAAAEAARLDSEADKEALLQAVIANGMSTSETRQVVQLRKRSLRALHDCLNEVLRMRPRVEKKHVYIGAITSPALRLGLSQMTQQERDRALDRALHRVLAEVQLGLKRLGPDRFTLAGASDFGILLAKLQDTLEHNVNEALIQEITNVHR